MRNANFDCRAGGSADGRGADSAFRRQSFRRTAKTRRSPKYCERDGSFRGRQPHIAERDINQSTRGRATLYKRLANRHCRLLCNDCALNGSRRGVATLQTRATALGNFCRHVRFEPQTLVICRAGADPGTRTARGTRRSRIISKPHNRSHFASSD